MVDNLTLSACHICQICQTARDMPDMFKYMPDMFMLCAGSQIDGTVLLDNMFTARASETGDNDKWAVFCLSLELLSETTGTVCLVIGLVVLTLPLIS